MSTHVVIIAGGAGTRFWPAGRRARPKQLLPVASQKTLLADTVDRCAGLAPPEQTYVVTNEVQREATVKECSTLPEGNILAEPHMRNTAAAIGLAAIEVVRRDPDAVMVVLPADHVIRPRERFVSIFSAAAERAAATDVLLTVGIEPTGPATGYGYIEAGDVAAEVAGHRAHTVKSFKEKPDAATAAGFLKAGGYFWNAGTFVWKASAILSAFEEHLPGHHAILQKIDAAGGGSPDPDLYATFENVPIDIGVMERAQNVEVIPADFEWDDAGSWLALSRLNEKDAQGNVVRGDHLGLDTHNCIVVSGEDHLIATIGLDDFVIVHTKDATLICPKGRAEEVRDMVARLKEHGRQDLT
ncbi:MAG: sugar phosphate nucleotidyltransferase [Planctomycetota bacterium]